MMTWQNNILDNSVFKKEFPFKSRFIQIDGHEIHYVDEGSGPVFLLLHGNPTFSFLYRKIISGLMKEHRLIALDYPGFGLSKAKDGYDYLPESHSEIVENFVTQLGLSEITLFVQDWGGPIGLGFAGRNPDLISRLIIGNTWAWPVNGVFHFEAFSKFMGGPIGRFLIMNKNLFVNSLLPAGTPKSKITSEVLKIYQDAMPKERRIATYIFPRAITGSKSFLVKVQSGLLSLIDKPTLILWGNSDFAFKKREMNHFESIFMNHKTIILAGCGHFIQEEAPEIIVTEILKWMLSHLTIQETEC